MCGIFCLVERGSQCLHPKEPPEWTLCKDLVANRGPDRLSSFVESISENRHAHFYASVLWMQGSQPVTQPLVDSDSNVLLWNGDVFSGTMFNEKVCDTEVVLSALQNTRDIPCILKKIKGPFSICYYQRSSKLLYFARDRFGRHSLLFKIDKTNQSILLTSTAVKSIEDIVEVPAVGVFIVDLSNENMKFICIPWFEPDNRVVEILDNFSKHFDIHVHIVKTEYLPKIGDLFINKKSDCTKGFLQYTEIAKELLKFDEIMYYLLKEQCINKTVNDLLQLLNEAIRKRVNIVPNFCTDCTKSNLLSKKCEHVKIGLLFSGGLDSAVLAALAHNHIDTNESIDLINVAFEKKNNSNYDVPDRKTGRQTYNELLKLYPERNYNFIEVDISQEELSKYRSTQISNLTYPLTTVLDESLACAVWFASRGKGTIYSTKEAYRSTCRVLLLGMGADEQFGGYLRHRTTLKRQGWDVLAEELKLEFDRISARNLGRDDRVVADHGRQSRLPYLDEDLVEFVQKLPPWERCCPTEEFPAGLGDKLLLRLLARRIGLTLASQLPKRAFQFGSRIADGRENAKDPSKRL